MIKRVLYQIKSLDKLIFRRIVESDDCDFEKIKRMPSPTQMHIIEYILESPEKVIYQSDLEEILSLRRATVSGVLHTMEANGLITRITNENDTRKKNIILNEKTKEIFIKKRRNMEKIENDIIKDIPQKDLDKFFDVIEKMKQNVKD